MNILVCGAGHQGLSMAAHLALNGESVFIWNRTQNNIQYISETGVIRCDGVVSGNAKIAKVSSEIGEVISDFVMITTPSDSHKDIAKRIAPYVHRNMAVVLNPGRTLGAVEFAEELKKNGVEYLPHIAETQTIVYTCRKTGTGSTNIIAMKNEVEIAAIRGSDIDYIMERMPDCLRRYFKAVESVGKTSFSNVGMILHCAPVLMNVGWIESEKVDFKYYYDGISKSIAGVLEKMDEERLKVAAALGYKVDSVVLWLKKEYGVSGETLYECIRNNEAYQRIDAPPALNCRYIFEDVPNGLVPIEYLGKCAGVETPVISMFIDLASVTLNEDFREKGRKYSVEVLKRYF